MDCRDEKAAGRVTRRDFLDGAGKLVGAAGLASSVPQVLYAAGTGSVPSDSVPAADGSYPPILQGIRGQTDASFAVGHAMRDGKDFSTAAATGEAYDLVVVGAGMSGLAAAYFYKKAQPAAKILVLDACDDFGGHARRNEFHVRGRTLLGAGGTQRIMFPNTYTPDGKMLLADIGVNAERYYKVAATDAKRVEPFKLGTAAFFDRSIYGHDKLVDDYPSLMPSYIVPVGATWQNFLRRSPLSPQAQQDMLHLILGNGDYMPGTSIEEKTKKLRSISYADYLTNYVKIRKEALDFVHHQVGGSVLNIGAGPDTFSAWMAYRAHLPGFVGMGLPHLRLSDVVPDDQMGDDIVFPEGNATVARLLVRWLNPKALPGSTMEDSILQQLNYAMLDAASSDVRIRLSSTAVRVEHDRKPDESEYVVVTYVRDGETASVRAGTCVMACFNVIIPYVCPELPAAQKEALKLAVRKPLIATQVALNNWRAFAKAKVNFICSPDSFYQMSILSTGNSLGNGYVPASPDDPAMINMFMAPDMPGVSNARDQYRAARSALLGIDRATYEESTRDQLQRMLGSAGFNADRDIAGITVNRWAHGYACGANDLYDSFPGGEEPCLRARKRFGRIAIANSDAAGISMTQAAFDQANRAVRELISDVVRPEFYALNPSRG